MKILQLFFILLFLTNIFLVLPLEASILKDQVGIGTESTDIKDVFQDPGTDEDPRDVIVSIIKYFITFLGLIFTILIILGGFRWMTAGGSEEKVNNAKKTVITASIGMVVILSAYAITVFVSSFVFDSLEGTI